MCNLQVLLEIVNYAESVKSDVYINVIELKLALLRVWSSLRVDISYDGFLLVLTATWYLVH